MMLSGATGWMNVSQIEVLVTRACDPSLHEPNYAHHLEVAEYIKNKKANTPREAAMLLARFANHRNRHIGILALSLLDTLVQSCGYPFQLQISTKEFLNELVRHFPERPPPFPGPVMSRILELIHGWREGICVESRWKDDLANIRDMHRLLTFKGYRFREVPRPNEAMSVAANLKTAEELENEDREAQSAKLQELIRRGTPRDLAAAQELMKALAGANPSAKPDYRSQALTELNKLETKVILLNEMLDNADTERGEKFVKGDVYDQVSAMLMSARPKIQKWISDAETEDSESLDTFLQINDQMNTVLNRYEAFKKGDYSFSSNPIPSEMGGSAKNNLSLIDFDDSEPSNGAVSLGQPTDDLAGLFSSGPSAASSQPSRPSTISSTSYQEPPHNRPPTINPSTRPVNSSNPSSSNPESLFGSIMLPGTPTAGGSASTSRVASPNYFGQSNGGGSAPQSMSGSMTMGSMMPREQQTMQPQSPPQQQQQQQASQTSAKDPFADLVGLF